MQDIQSMTASSSGEQLQDDANNIIKQRYEQYVEPFWQENMVSGYLQASGQVQIAYAYVTPPNPIGSIAISSGRIECLLKYKELIFNLYHAGYAVFIHDHRGQGLSGRMTDNPQQGYVEDFDQYVEDFKLFYDQVIAPNSENRPFLLCHSMGSAIGALYMLKYPDDFARCVFTAPMFGIRPAMPDALAKLLINLHLGLNSVLSPSLWYFWGQQDYLEVLFKDNVLTHSEIRYELFRAEYERHPNIKIGGVTSLWLKAALVAMREIEDKASRIEIPILHLQAGKDSVVDNSRQVRVCKKFPNCKSVFIDGAYHELLMEVDEFRDTCLREIVAFFQRPC